MAGVLRSADVTCFVFLSTESSPVNQSRKIDASIKVLSKLLKLDNFTKIILLNHHTQAQGDFEPGYKSQVLLQSGKIPAAVFEVGSCRRSIDRDLNCAQQRMKVRNLLPVFFIEEQAVGVQADLCKLQTASRIYPFEQIEVDRAAEGIAIATQGQLFGSRKKLLPDNVSYLFSPLPVCSGRDQMLRSTARTGEVAALVKTEIEPDRGCFKQDRSSGDGVPGTNRCGFHRIGWCIRKARTVPVVAVMIAAVEDRFADFNCIGTVPDFGNCLLKQISRRALQPGRAAEEDRSVRMYVAPLKGSRTDIPPLRFVKSFWQDEKFS